MTHHRISPNATQAQQSTRKRRPISLLHDRVPVDWEEPLSVTIDHAVGFRDEEHDGLAVNSDELRIRTDRANLPAMYGDYLVAFLCLVRWSDPAGVVLNPIACIERADKHMSEKRARSFLWALIEMGAVR